MNFINPKTKEKHLVVGFITKIIDGEPQYFEKPRGKKRIVGSDGTPLVKLGEISSDMAVFAEGQVRLARNKAYFKQRSVNHGNTEESKLLKKKMEKKQLDNIKPK